jgi:lactobin A/cerein 7B family class IIb bacteriocin
MRCDRSFAMRHRAHGERDELTMRRLRMNIDVAAMPDQWSDIHALTDAEMEDVSGGFVPFALAALFFAGMYIGSEIHKAYFEG